MITPFGKELRKARVDLDMAQADMAKTIGVSPAYLSAVETGKRKATYALCERIGRLTKDKALEVKLKNLVSLESGMVPIHNLEQAQKALVLKICSVKMEGTFIANVLKMIQSYEALHSNPKQV